jgi:hypothetical protein
MCTEMSDLEPQEDNTNCVRCGTTRCPGWVCFTLTEAWGFETLVNLHEKKITLHEKRMVFVSN